jgi:hypothetical protein
VGGLSTVLMACLFYLQVYLEGAPPVAFWFLCLLSPNAAAMGIDKVGNEN